MCSDIDVKLCHIIITNNELGGLINVIEFQINFDIRADV